jgi:acyl-coenzyme A thioesterase PaaI-like protein
MLTPWGTLNGSVMNGLLELPSFVALLPELERGELPVTNDIFIQHLRGLPGEAEYALEGRVLRRGKSMAWTEAQARVGGRICSLARITKTLVEGPLGR